MVSIELDVGKNVEEGQFVIQGVQGGFFRSDDVEWGFEG